MHGELFSQAVSNHSKVALGLRPVAVNDRMSSRTVGCECSAAFGEIYEQFHDRILRLALRITRNLHDAEDVVQECFMRAFLHLDTFSGKSKLSTWISRIAINAALMKIRRRRRFEFSLDERVETPLAKRPVEIECDGPTPDEELLQRELAKILAEGLAKLSPGLFRVVDLHYYEELSARECAEVLGISLSSAKARILRARLKLRLVFYKRFRQPSVPSRSLLSEMFVSSLGWKTARGNYAAARPCLRKGDKYETRMACGA